MGTYSRTYWRKRGQTELLRFSWGEGEELEEGGDDQEDDLGGDATSTNPIEEMVGAMVVIEEDVPSANAVETPETKVGATTEAVTMKARVYNATIEEDKVANIGYFWEINPEFIDIESCSKIRGTIIEEEEPLA